MTDLNESQIDMMNTYVRKQEEFTIDMMRRLLETQAKLELSDGNAKNNAGMVTELVQNSAKTIQDLEKKHADELHSKTLRVEVLERDYKVLQTNYELTRKELETCSNRLHVLNDIENRYNELSKLHTTMQIQCDNLTKKLESLQKLNTKKTKTVETKKESGTSNGPLE